MKLWSLAGVLLMSVSSQGALVGWWAQDELSGDLIDATGAHPSATLSPLGAVEYGQPGVPAGIYGSIVVANTAGRAIGYGPNVSDDFFIMPGNDTPMMSLDRTSAFTLMSWINPQQPDAPRTYRPLSTGGAAGADGGWGLGLRLNDTAGSSATVRFTSYAVADNDSAPFAVAFGEWIHIAVTYNNGAIDYYLNGALLDGSDVSLFNNPGPNASATIGARLGGNDSDQTFGLLDGVQVHDQVLTAAEIRAAAALSVVPEPSAAALVVLGAIGLAGRRRRRE
ncbi:MAG: LamG-like jellyroll fold domain-containing protein [Chthoniobacteraceae bacterium]